MTKWLADLAIPNIEAAQDRTIGAGIAGGTPVRVKYKFSWWNPLLTAIEKRWGSIRPDPAIRKIAFRDDAEGREAYAKIARWMQGR